MFHIYSGNKCDTLFIVCTGLTSRLGVITIYSIRGQEPAGLMSSLADCTDCVHREEMHVVSIVEINETN